MYFLEKATFESPTRHQPDINISTLTSIPTHLLFVHTPLKGKSKNGLIQLPALKRGLRKALTRAFHHHLTSRINLASFQRRRDAA